MIQKPWLPSLEEGENPKAINARQLSRKIKKDGKMTFVDSLNTGFQRH